MSSLQERLSQYREEHGIKQRQPGELKVIPKSVWPFDPDVNSPDYQGYQRHVLSLADEVSAIKEQFKREQRHPNREEQKIIDRLVYARSFC